MAITDIEILKDNIESISSISSASFFVAQRIFKDMYKDKETTEIKILTSIGMEFAAIKILYNKLKNQLNLLEEIIEENKIKVLTEVEIIKEEKEANVLSSR